MNKIIILLVLVSSLYACSRSTQLESTSGEESWGVTTSPTQASGVDGAQF